jgi:hypothetical protein
VCEDNDRNLLGILLATDELTPIDTVTLHLGINNHDIGDPHSQKFRQSLWLARRYDVITELLEEPEQSIFKLS